jgi:hypothetical protein
LLEDWVAEEIETEVLAKRKRINFVEELKVRTCEQEENSCPACTEHFTEPPYEDWIQCGILWNGAMKNACLVMEEFIFVTCVGSC